MKDNGSYRNILLENLVKMKQETVKKFVTNELLEYYDEVYTGEGFVFAKGTYPVLLVAHMDTVHKETVKRIKYDGAVISSPQGIGGDDRCGVYLVLEMIKKFKCSVVFTEDEEKGCIGATSFTKSECIDMCENIKYIVEFDRRGHNDAVFYQCDNPDFTKFVESTGYFKKAWGTCSDISVIAPVLKIAAVNLSSGYHNEHSAKETINLIEVETILKEAMKLVALEVEKPYEYIEKSYGTNWRYWDDDDDIYWWYHYRDKDPKNYKDYGTFLCSNENKLAKKIYHIYADDPETGLQICVEVFAFNENEAVGIALTHYSSLSYEDISQIVDSSSQRIAKK